MRKPGAQHWSTIVIVARAPNLLYIERERNAAPKERVVAFDDTLRSVVQSAISQQEAQAAERKIHLRFR